MPFSESHAKSLLRNLPSRTVILENRRYWDLTFLGVYLDHCDGVLFENPRLGLELAELAPELAVKVPEKSPEEWKYMGAAEKQLHRELVVRSFAVWGGGLRATARFKDGERAYRLAYLHAETGPVSAAVKANLDKRFAKLRSAQGRFSEALELLDSALAYYSGGDPVRYADALNTKGYVLGEAGRYAEAVALFGEALILAKGTRRTSKLANRTVFCCAHNLAACVLERCGPDSLIAVLSLVIEAKRYQAKRRNAMNKQRLAWVEARIHARLGCERKAERLLIAARKKFVELGAPLEAALVSLERAVLYLHWAEWPRLTELALETFGEFRALSSHSEAIAALRVWVEGSQAGSLTTKRLREVQRTIESLVVKGQRF